MAHPTSGQLARTQGRFLQSEIYQTGAAAHRSESPGDGFPTLQGLVGEQVSPPALPRLVAVGVRELRISPWGDEDLGLYPFAENSSGIVVQKRLCQLHLKCLSLVAE